MTDEKLKAAIEAALFMTNQPISIEKLSKILKRSPEKIKAIIEEFREEFLKEEHGIHVLETSVGYQIRVKPELVSSVSNLTPYRDLGRGLLRVLALVAYKQPITQSEIVKVLGNRTYEYVKRLEERGLIKTLKHSRTKALVATKEFANYFGLENPEDAKKFFEDMEKNPESNKENQNFDSVET
ncbi:SMC-Scp complex subunit ScpB [Candidatus Micrarchaeota archaeon RBG_16_36_9]|nr:MAG: SMC-Scp complex subunit ScpB [Candidatus Micrarchaeota archaeon RBG_16_36_9]